MNRINHSHIRSEWKKNHVVVVEFQRRQCPILRAIVQKIPKQGNNVDTMYGEVQPEKLFSFYTLPDAQKFINEI